MTSATRGGLASQNEMQQPFESLLFIAHAAAEVTYDFHVRVGRSPALLLETQGLCGELFALVVRRDPGVSDGLAVVGRQVLHHRLDVNQVLAAVVARRAPRRQQGATLAPTHQWSICICTFSKPRVALRSLD